VSESGIEITVPSEDLFQFVAEAIRRERMSRLEDMSWPEFVEGLGRDNTMADLLRGITGNG